MASNDENDALSVLLNNINDNAKKCASVEKEFCIAAVKYNTIGSAFKSIKQNLKVYFVKEDKPEKSIKKISNIDNKLRGKKIGKKNAIEIYDKYKEESVNWNYEKYFYKSSKYSSKVKKNHKIAIDASCYL